MLEKALLILNAVIALYSHGDTIDKKQLFCLSQAVYWEAGGESVTTKAYVAKFIMNYADKHDKTICQEIYSFKGRYTGNHIYQNQIKIRADNGLEWKAWRESVETSMFVMDDALDLDFSKIDGATNFVSPNALTHIPDWYDERKIVFEYQNFAFLDLNS